MSFDGIEFWPLVFVPKKKEGKLWHRHPKRAIRQYRRRIKRKTGQKPSKSEAYYYFFRFRDL